MCTVLRRLGNRWEAIARVRHDLLPSGKQTFHERLEATLVEGSRGDGENLFFSCGIQTQSSGDRTGEMRAGLVAAPGVKK